jgi:hypothetical protein
MSDRELNDLGIGRSEIKRWTGLRAADPQETPDRAEPEASRRR